MINHLDAPFVDNVHPVFDVKSGFLQLPVAHSHADHHYGDDDGDDDDDDYDDDDDGDDDHDDYDDYDDDVDDDDDDYDGNEFATLNLYSCFMSSLYIAISTGSYRKFLVGFKSAYIKVSDGSI